MKPVSRATDASTSALVTLLPFKMESPNTKRANREGLRRLCSQSRMVRSSDLNVPTFRFVGTFPTVLAMASNFNSLKGIGVHLKPQHARHVIEVAAVGVGVRGRTDDQIEEGSAWGLQ